MNENINDSNINILREKYANMPKINFMHFLKSVNIETLEKLGIYIENRKYTEYEYDIIVMKIYNYHEVDKDSTILQIDKLTSKNVTKNEYEEILDIFNKISSYYNL